MDKNILKFKRRKQRAELTVIAGIAMLIIALMIFLFTDITWATASAGVVGLVVFFLGFSSYAEVHENFKKDFLQDLMVEWVDEGRYEPRQGLTEYQVYNTQFFKYADEFHSQDLLSGSINGIPFISSDLILKERTTAYASETSRVHYRPFFKGRMFTFDFNQTFEGELLILEGQRPSEAKNYQRFQTDDDAFDRKFTVYSNSRAMVKDMMTEDFIASLHRLEENHEGNLSISFTETKLHIAINTQRDTFALKFFKPLNETMLETFKKDVRIIFEVIETLKLNDAPFVNKS